MGGRQLHLQGCMQAVHTTVHGKEQSLDLNLLMELLLLQDRKKVLCLKGKGSKHCLAPSE